MRNTILAITATLSLSGCASMVPTQADLDPGKGTTFEITGRDYPEIWQTAVVVLSNFGLSITELNEAGGKVQAFRGMTWNSNGENVALYITPPRSGEKKYSVEVVSVKASKVQITGPDWEPKIEAAMKEKLGE